MDTLDLFTPTRKHPLAICASPLLARETRGLPGEWLLGASGQELIPFLEERAPASPGC